MISVFEETVKAKEDRNSSNKRKKNMKIPLCLILVWAFVNEANAGTINVRNASQLTSEDALMVEELVPLSRGIPKCPFICTSNILREKLTKPIPSLPK